MLEEYAELAELLSQQQYFFLAESYYRTENITAAASTFSQVTENNPFYHQSLYRLAEIHRQQGENDLALTFLKKIVETEENSRWKQYAERDLQYDLSKDRY